MSGIITNKELTRLSALLSSDGIVDNALCAGQHVGIRIIDNGARGYNYGVGRIAPRSWMWIDNNITSKRLPGTSALRLTDYGNSTIGGYYGSKVLLLISDSADGGEDRGELVMHNAVIAKDITNIVIFK